MTGGSLGGPASRVASMFMRSLPSLLRFAEASLELGLQSPGQPRVRVGSGSAGGEAHPDRVFLGVEPDPEDLQRSPGVVGAAGLLAADEFSQRLAGRLQAPGQPGRIS